MPAFQSPTYIKPSVATYASQVLAASVTLGRGSIIFLRYGRHPVRRRNGASRVWAASDIEALRQLGRLSQLSSQRTTATDPSRLPHLEDRRSILRESTRHRRTSRPPASVDYAGD